MSGIESNPGPFDVDPDNISVVWHFDHEILYEIIHIILESPICSTTMYGIYCPFQ